MSLTPSLDIIQTKTALTIAQALEVASTTQTIADRLFLLQQLTTFQGSFSAVAFTVTVIVAWILHKNKAIDIRIGKTRRTYHREILFSGFMQSCGKYLEQVRDLIQGHTPFRPHGYLGKREVTSRTLEGSRTCYNFVAIYVCENVERYLNWMTAIPDEMIARQAHSSAMISVQIASVMSSSQNRRVTREQVSMDLSGELAKLFFPGIVDRPEYHTLGFSTIGQAIVHAFDRPNKGIDGELSVRDSTKITIGDREILSSELSSFSLAAVVITANSRITQIIPLSANPIAQSALEKAIFLEQTSPLLSEAWHWSNAHATLAAVTDVEHRHQVTIRTFSEFDLHSSKFRNPYEAETLSAVHEFLTLDPEGFEMKKNSKKYLEKGIHRSDIYSEV